MQKRHLRIIVVDKLAHWNYQLDVPYSHQKGKGGKGKQCQEWLEGYKIKQNIS